MEASDVAKQARLLECYLHINPWHIWSGASDPAWRCRHRQCSPRGQAPGVLLAYQSMAYLVRCQWPSLEMQTSPMQPKRPGSWSVTCISIHGIFGQVPVTQPDDADIIDDAKEASVLEIESIETDISPQHLVRCQRPSLMMQTSSMMPKRPASWRLNQLKLTSVHNIW